MAEIINFEEARKRRSSKRSRPKRTTDDDIKKEVMMIALEINERVLKLLKLIHQK